MRLGEVIRRWRKMAERDATDVASEIGIGPSTLTRLEGGATPNGETLAAVLRWLLEDRASATSAPEAAGEDSVRQSS